MLVVETVFFHLLLLLLLPLERWVEGEEAKTSAKTQAAAQALMALLLWWPAPSPYCYWCCLCWCLY
jgi:hypothetical protein